jgi:pantothenate kinase type III
MGVSETGNYTGHNAKNLQRFHLRYLRLIVTDSNRSSTLVGLLRNVMSQIESAVRDPTWSYDDASKMQNLLDLLSRQHVVFHRFPNTEL